MPFQLRLRQLPFYCLLFIVTYLSTMPSVEAPGVDLSDKVLHFLAYFGVTGAAYFGFPKASWRLAVFVILWGIGIELVQWQLPTRMFELLDILANSLGCLAGWQLMQLLRHLCRRITA